MMKITKTILSRIWWLGRGTATMMGVAVMLALTVGLASTALAGTGVGAPFNLGKVNTVNAVSQLVGSVAGPMLTVDNNSAGANATALDLQVEPGKAPMKVNSGAKVANLNADKLDGKDQSAFFSGKTYQIFRSVDGEGGGDSVVIEESCDPGDKVLGGGGGSPNLDDALLKSIPTGGGAGWQVVVLDNGIASPTFVLAQCTDFPPLR